MISNATLVCIEPSKARAVLPFVRDMLEDAYKHGDETVPPIEEFESGKILLWIAWGDERKIIAAMTTALVRMKTGLACKIIALGGEQMQRWLAFLADIEAYAKREGCYRVLFEGREGWERLLPEYKRAAVLLEKRI